MSVRGGRGEAVVQPRGELQFDRGGHVFEPAGERGVHARGKRPARDDLGQRLRVGGRRRVRDVDDVARPDDVGLHAQPVALQPGRGEWKKSARVQPARHHVEPEFARGLIFVSQAAHPIPIVRDTSSIPTATTGSSRPAARRAVCALPRGRAAGRRPGSTARRSLRRAAAPVPGSWRAWLPAPRAVRAIRS